MATPNWLEELQNNRRAAIAKRKQIQDEHAEWLERYEKEKAEKLPGEIQEVIEIFLPQKFKELHEKDQFSKHLVVSVHKVGSSYSFHMGKYGFPEHWPYYHDTFDKVAEMIEKNQVPGMKGKRIPWNPTTEDPTEWIFEISTDLE